MATTDVPNEVPLDTPVRSCRKVQSSVYWPAPIDQRLNELVQATEETGERLSKADLLAGLVVAAVPNGEQLGELVRAYRRATVRDIFGASTDADVVRLDERRPGRRRVTKGRE